MWLIMPLFLCVYRYTTISEARNNARHLGTLLVLYEQDHGHLPSSELATSPEARPQNREDSNYILGQLIRGGYTDSEEVFFANIKGRTKKADGITEPDAELLSRGECGFTYISFPKGLVTAENKDAKGKLPILVSPLFPNSELADREPFDGRAVYLRLDSSVQQKRINEEGHIMVNQNQHLFQTGPDTRWGDKRPKFHHPLYLE